MSESRRIDTENEKLKDHVGMTFLHDTIVTTYGLEDGRHELVIATTNSYWEANLLYQGGEFCIVQDDYNISIIRFMDVLFDGIDFIQKDED